MTQDLSGSCLCGSTRYRANGPPIGGGHCHCIACRKTSGTGHGSHLAVPASGFDLEGTLSQYDAPADSGNIVTRYFCPGCGAAMYSTNSGMPGLVMLRASSLDDPELFTPQMVVYAKHAPSWDLVDPALPAFQGMPPTEAMPDA